MYVWSTSSRECQKIRETKPAVKWTGPYRVVSGLSEHICLVEDLLSGKKADLHGRRLAFFRNKDFTVTDEVRNHLVYQQNELLVVADFHDIHQVGEQVDLLTQWRGFDSSESPWVYLTSLREDVPMLVDAYIEDARKNGTAPQKKLVVSL